MPAIPVVHCRNVQESLFFYTRILDFEKKYPEARDTDWVIDLIRHDINDVAEIQLSQHPGDGAFGCAINIRGQNVDALFAKYLSRGLDTSGHDTSPVHHGPVEQTWSLREFYVTDADGNTLRFGNRYKSHSKGGRLRLAITSVMDQSARCSFRRNHQNIVGTKYIEIIIAANILTCASLSEKYSARVSSLKTCSRLATTYCPSLISGTPSPL